MQEDINKVAEIASQIFPGTDPTAISKILTSLTNQLISDGGQSGTAVSTDKFLIELQEDTGNIDYYIKVLTHKPKK